MWRLAAAALVLLSACRPPTGAGPVAAPPGAVAPPSGRTAITSALVPTDPGDLPDLSVALSGDRQSLIAALDASLAWFQRSSSRERFPVGRVTHEWARASLYAFRQLAGAIADSRELARRLQAEFDFHRSVGSDGRGTVLFTGYYSPAFEASLQADGHFKHPLYRPPPDLVVDAGTGEVKGRRVGQRVVTYPTRADIEKSGMLAGTELVWLRDAFEAYLIHVQGSAALLLPDGKTFHVAYAGNNGHDYVSVARELVADGKLREDQLSLDQIRGYFEANPQDVERYLHRNPRFVFFRESEGSEWPAGSLGVRVTPLRSLAADKALFPPGGVVLVVTQAPAPGDAGVQRRFVQFMLDQDSGGAIRTPGRADIYFGIGPSAEARAGRQYAEGGLYYLFLKPERLAHWRAQVSPGS